MEKLEKEILYNLFNKFKDENGINNGTELAEEVLKEIPRQLEEYYHFCGKFYE